jgi:hypothetical protein
MYICKRNTFAIESAINLFQNLSSGQKLAFDLRLVILQADAFKQSKKLNALWHEIFYDKNRTAILRLHYSI